MKKLVFIVIIPLIASCSFLGAKPSKEDMEKVKIENAIITLKETFQIASVGVSLHQDDSLSFNFCDFNHELLDLLPTIQYKEIKQKSGTQKSIVRIGNGEDCVNITLKENLDYIIVDENKDGAFSPSAKRYYSISKEDGLKIKDLANKVQQDYETFIDVNSSNGNIDDYFIYRKPSIYACYKDLSSDDMKFDQDNLVYEEIKKAQYTKIDKGTKSFNYIVDYDINQNRSQNYFTWQYDLADDYQTVRLIFYVLGTTTKTFFYQIDEANGQEIARVAKMHTVHTPY